MVKQYNFSPYATKLSFKAEEGNVTVAEAMGEFGKLNTWTFASEMKKGDYVTLDGDLKVKIAGANDEIIGVCVADPEWEGVRPNASVVAANAPKRRVTVQLLGNWVREYEVAANNAAIAVGDSIKLTSTNKFDKSTTANNTRVLKSVAALAGGTVIALTGYYGI